MKRRIAITIKPTNDCNMRCRHCYHAEEGFDSTEMDPTYAKMMLKVASREYQEIHVVFHGGEPTLWGVENFKEVLEFQKALMSQNDELVFKNSIQTNGLLLNDDWFILFKEYNFSIGVSFDGPHNDDLRANTQLVYNNMLNMKEYGLNFGVLCVESSLSIGNLKSTYDWFNSEGFNFKVLALFMSGNAKEHSELELNISEYVDNLVEMYEYWLYDKNCKISMRTFEDLLKVSDRLYCIQYGGSCIYNRICINPNGDLYPCGRPYTDDFVLGNIENLDLISDAFKTPAYERLSKISSERVKQCKDNCTYYGVCKGGCVSSAILEGSFDKIN
ncbi:MAG: radical SAM protein, partial [Hominimerdicola sp.]